MPCFSSPKKPIRRLAVKAACAMLLTVYAAADEGTLVLDELMREYQALGQFNGVVLVSDGDETLLREGYGYANMEWQVPNTPAARFSIGSVTKALTAMIVAQLIEERLLHVDDEVSKHLGWYRPDTGNEITIGHLLTHQDGLPNYTRDPDYWQSYEDGVPYPTRKYIEKYCSGDLEFQPGSEYRYGNAGYSVLGAIIEAVTGKRYADVAAERILAPFGMSASGIHPHYQLIESRAEGYQVAIDGYRRAAPIHKPFFAAGSAYSTVDDLDRYLRALDNDELVSYNVRRFLFEERTGAVEGSFAYGWSVGRSTLNDNVDAGRFVATNGEVNGFNALAIRLVDDDKNLILLNNTGEVELFDIATNILRVLYRLPHDEPAPRVRDRFYGLLHAEGLGAALQFYREQREQHPQDYIYRRWPLRILAGQLMADGRLDDAESVLRLNLETHPGDAQSTADLAMLKELR